MTELHETLSIDDVEKACEALDIVAAAEKRAADRAKSKSKGRHR